MKNITSKTTFTAIAALFFATSLYATDMKSNEMSMAKDPMPMTKDAMPMQKTLCQCKMTKWHLMG